MHGTACARGGQQIERIVIGDILVTCQFPRLGMAECLILPAQDIVSFGRLEIIEGMNANDVVLSLPDPTATRQISRWHFELRRRPGGFMLRAVSSQFTSVDAQALGHGQEAPVVPGTQVQLAGVMTLEFLADAPGFERRDDATHYVAKR